METKDERAEYWRVVCIGVAAERAELRQTLSQPRVEALGLGLQHNRKTVTNGGGLVCRGGSQTRPDGVPVGGNGCTCFSCPRAVSRRSAPTTPSLARTGSSIGAYLGFLSGCTGYLVTKLGSDTFNVFGSMSPGTSVENDTSGHV